MTENIENLIIEHLRAIRADIAIIKQDVHDIKLRLSSLEGHQAALHQDTYAHSMRIDTLDSRIGRLETRLELRDV